MGDARRNIHNVKGSKRQMAVQKIADVIIEMDNTHEERMEKIQETSRDFVEKIVNTENSTIEETTEDLIAEPVEESTEESTEESVVVQSKPTKPKGRPKKKVEE